MNQQKSFMFYTSWEFTLLELTLEERWTFVHNLMKFYSNRENELEFPTRIDSITWKGVLPALEINRQKWNERAERSRENGGKNRIKTILPSVPLISQGVEITPTNTQQVISEPERPVNGQLSTVNCELETDNGQLSTVNCELETDNGQLSTVNCELETDNGQLSTVNCELETDNDKTEDYHHLLHKVTDRNIDEIESILNRKFASVPTWKKVLKTYGPTEFIEKYQHIINWSNQLSVDINKYFNEMILSTN
jgi:hypothetical protein